MIDTGTVAFRIVCRLVLGLFLFQALQPSNFGWSQPPQPQPSTVAVNGGLAAERLLSWLLGISPAHAQDPPLAATPEADGGDPVIAQKAAELGRDPARIFAFVRDEIGYESYKGSLRGARGTLWSKAGNALDQASLLIALLRAANIPARYVQGTLADAQAQNLILAMFPLPLRVIGCPEPGTEVADPAHDPKLLGETREHYWVQLDAGGGFQDADPAFAEAQLGQTFAAAQGTFTEVPDSLRHKVTVRLRRELTLPLSGLFGAPSQDVATVLEETFITAALAGKPLSLGHFVNSSSIGAIFSAVTHTYSPYLALGEVDAAPEQAQVARGQSYQEVLTNFPFGSQVLTGVFLELEVSGPDGPTETFQRSLVDRIGFAIRQTGGSPDLGIDPSVPALTEADIVTLHVLPGLTDPASPGQLPQRLNALAERAATVPAENPPSAETGARVSSLLRDTFITLTRAFGSVFLMLSDRVTGELAQRSLVKAYFDRPRLVLVSSPLKVDPGTQTATASFAIDLRRDRVRSLAFPGQSAAAAQAFNANRGLAESIAERDALSFLLASDQTQAAVSTASIFEAALAQKVALTAIDRNRLVELDSLAISPQAKARIAEAAARGKAVIVPTQPVSLAGAAVIGWYEVDPATGETIGVSEDGGHQGFVDETTLQGLIGLTIGFLLSLVGIILLTCARTGDLGKCLEGALKHGANTVAGAVGWAFAQSERILNRLSHAFDPPPPPCRPPSRCRSQAHSLEGSAEAAITAEAAEFPRDDSTFAALLEGIIQIPLLGVAGQAGDYLFSPAPSDALGNLTGAGVAIGIVPDAQFTLPFQGAQLPTVFRVGVRNLTGAADTFALSFADVPPGFAAQASVPRMTIPAGETAEIGLCLRPVGGLAAPGTPASFTGAVNSVANPAVTASATESFTVPAVHGVALASDPPVLSSLPGATVATTLTLQAVGNVPETVALEITLPAGLTADKLGPVSLGVGESATRTLTLTPSPSAPLNSTLIATLRAHFGAPAPETLLLPVQVVVPGAQSVGQAATAADQLGKPELAARLDDLGIALTNLVQNPESAVFKGQALANLDSVIGQLANDPALSVFAANLTAARNALMAANTLADIQAAVGTVGGALDAFSTGVTGLAQHDFTVSLLPASQAAQPQVPAQFQLVLQNRGSAASTYNLSLAGLPPEVTGQLGQPALALAPGQVSSVSLTLTPTSTTELVPFGFQVVVSVAEAPGVTRTAQGSLTVREELVSVVVVASDPPFADPGQPVDISARLLNAVNRQQQALVSFTVLDPGGQGVFTSAPVQTELTVQTSLTTVELGALDTTGLALGDYTIRVTVTDPSGQPIPGATGEGTLLLGSPVTASITVSPDILPPGDSIVTTRLQIDSRLTTLPPLSLLGQAPIAGGASGVAVRNNLAYVCGGSGIHIVDISNPQSPMDVKTFGPSGSRGCLLQGDLLLVTQGLNPSFILQVYSIKNDPLNPVLLGTSGTILYHLPFDLYATASHAFVALRQNCFLLGNNDIYVQLGDLLSIALNLNDPLDPTAASPALAQVLFNTHGDASFDPTDISGCAESGGDYNIWQIVQADPQTLLLASTTATGTDTQTGVGRIFSIDIADPAQPQIVNELQIPGTVHAIGMAIEGSRALVVGSSGGLQDFGDTLLTGNLVLTVLDVSNPRAPQILGSRPITLPSRAFWTSLSGLGNGLFAFANLGSQNEGPQLLLIDASNPGNIVVSQTDAPSEIIGPNAIRTTGNLLLATSDGSGLLIYNIGEIPVLPITARVSVPKSTGVTVLPNTFTVPPTQIIPGPDQDTLLWELSFSSGLNSQILTWQEALTGLQPGESRPVTLETTIDFTSQGTPGQITLPPLEVAVQQILSLDPASRTVRPGEAAGYTVTVQNPTAARVTYSLAVQGVPPAGVTLPATLTLPPNGSQALALTLATDPFAALGSYDFVVTAQADTGAVGSVVGTLELQGQPVLPTADTQAHGVVVGLTPAQATAGQGTGASYIGRVTNVGSETAVFTLSGGFPAGVSAAFSETQVTLAPGASNFHDITLTLTPAPGTVAGAYPFSVSASATDGSATGQAGATLTVTHVGVAVELIPTGAMHFDLRVTNTGAVRETFVLSLAGPLAVVAQLAAASVTLDPGQSTLVAIEVGALPAALPGGLTLVAVASAQTDAAVRAADSAVLAVGASQGVTVEISPAQQTAEPGQVKRFSLQVRNTGNQEGAFQAAISAIQGPVSASLQGLDGQPTQRIAVFRLPALASGVLVLEAVLQQAQAGAVTVTVSALSDPAVSASATAGIAPEGVEPIPIPTLSGGLQALLLLLLLGLGLGLIRRRYRYSG